jgi:predicted xylose isomerase-like sugar epimerase
MHHFKIINDTFSQRLASEKALTPHGICFQESKGLQNF